MRYVRPPTVWTCLRKDGTCGHLSPSFPVCLAVRSGYAGLCVSSQCLGTSVQTLCQKGNHYWKYSRRIQPILENGTEIRPPKWRFRWSWLKSGRIPPITEHPVDRPVIDLPTLDWIEQSDVVSKCVDMTRVGHVIICLVGYTRNQLFTIADGFALLHASVELQTYPGPRADSVIRVASGRGSGCEEVRVLVPFWVSPRIGLKTRGHRQDEIRRVVDTVACFPCLSRVYPNWCSSTRTRDVLVISNRRPFHGRTSQSQCLNLPAAQRAVCWMISAIFFTQ